MYPKPIVDVVGFSPGSKAPCVDPAAASEHSKALGQGPRGGDTGPWGCVVCFEVREGWGPNDSDVWDPWKLWRARVSWWEREQSHTGEKIRKNGFIPHVSAAMPRRGWGGPKTGGRGWCEVYLESHPIGTELKSNELFWFWFLLCAVLSDHTLWWSDFFFPLFFFCFPGPAVSTVDFTVGSTKLRLPLPPSPAFRCHCKSTAFFGRGVSGSKIGTRCCCTFFHNCRQIERREKKKLLKCLTCCPEGLPVILNPENNK